MDREPGSEGAGLPQWRIVAAFLLLGALALGLWAVGRGPGGSVDPGAVGMASTTSTTFAGTSEPPVTPSTTQPTTTQPTTTQPTTTQPTTTQPTTTQPTTTQPTATNAPTTTVTEPPAVVALDTLLTDTQSALSAWGLFAATGELSVVEDDFVIGGPQYEQLASEVAGLAATAVGLPAFEFTLGTPEIVADTPPTAVVRGTVSITRPDVAASERQWDITMEWFEDESRWRLLTVGISP